MLSSFDVELLSSWPDEGGDGGAGGAGSGGASGGGGGKGALSAAEIATIKVHTYTHINTQDTHKMNKN